MPALIRAASEGGNAPAHTYPITPLGSESVAVHQCRFCAEPLPSGGRLCPKCSKEIASAGNPPRELPLAARASDGSHTGAVYALECPIPCPHCSKLIRPFRVLRVLRTQVSFTSTLPRKGYVIVCPECEQLLSAELSGMI